MANRAQAKRRAVEQSAVPVGEVASAGGERPKRKKNGGARATSALYSSWGGDDLLFYFRWAESAIGFKGQHIEKGAETIRGKVDEFWDEGRARREALERRFPKRPKATPSELVPAAARPTQSQQVRGYRQPDRTTDAHLEAVRRHRRIEAGVERLRLEQPVHYVVVLLLFAPRQGHVFCPKVERELRQLKALVLASGRMIQAHQRAIAKVKGEQPPNLEAWLEARIDRNDTRLDYEDELLGAAIEEASAVALSAIVAFEAVTEEPTDVREAKREAAEGSPRARKPRAASPIDPALFDPPGWRS